MFYAIGDLPYNTRQAHDVKLQLRRLPKDADFIIHVGDIRNPQKSDVCRQDEFTVNEVAGILKQSHAPVLLIPGDNEYNDCRNFDQACAMWLNKFAYFERKHWKNDMPVEVHHMKRRPENFFFELQQVLFIGLNIVGGEPSTDNNGEEWKTRLNMEYIWTRSTVLRYVNTKAKASVVPGDKISTSLVECEHVKAKIGKALRADGSPRMWKKLPPARGQKGFLS